MFSQLPHRVYSTLYPSYVKEQSSVRCRAMFKHQFRHLVFYSIPLSTLYVVRKRLNLVTLTTTLFITLIFNLI